MTYHCSSYFSSIELWNWNQIPMNSIQCMTDYKSVNDSINEFSSIKSADDFEITYESTPVILYMIDR